MYTVTSADGTSIGFTKTGTGPPLVLVHGTTADHTRWTPILPSFERHFTVYAVDRRGRGGSGDAPDYDLIREAQDVAAVVDSAAAEQGQSVNVLGHSFGALCSLESALLTHNVRRLVLYEPPIPTGVEMYPPGILDRIDAAIEGGHNEAALEIFFREIVGMPDHKFEAYRQRAVWRTRIALAPTIAREVYYDQKYELHPERFVAIQVPTLLLVGGDSPEPMRAGAAAVHAAIPSSRVVSLAGQQHVAMDTDPALFTSEVLKFLLDAE
jgi:pimeloyl-ACP methyl ester carboxylesterase